MEATCDTCGKSFDAARSDARYCSGRCRTIAYRVRTTPEPSEPRRRRPLPEAFGQATRDSRKAAERISRLVADDRMPRNRESVLLANQWELMRARDLIDAALYQLSQDNDLVTDSEPDYSGPRPFKKSDTESLEEVVGTLADHAELIASLARPGEVEPDDAVRLAARARVAWQRIDRHLVKLTSPSRHKRLKS